MMLEVSNLAAGYGRIPILGGVTFAVAAGEFIGLMFMSPSDPPQRSR